MKPNLLLRCILVLALMLVASMPGQAGDRPRKQRRERDKPAAAPNNAVFDTVEATAFVLRDKKGARRATITTDSADVVRFAIGTQKNSGVFLLSVFPDGRAALILRDDRGRNRASMAIRADGSPAVSLSENANLILQDARGRNRAVLRMPAEGEPQLLLYDERMRSTVVKPGQEE